MALLACFTFGFFPGEYLSIFNPGRREADQFVLLFVSTGLPLDAIGLPTK